MSLLKGQLICRMIFNLRLSDVSYSTEAAHSWEECNSQCVLGASLQSAWCWYVLLVMLYQDLKRVMSDRCLYCKFHFFPFEITKYLRKHIFEILQILCFRFNFHLLISAFTNGSSPGNHKL